jgi:mevalonate kinase
MVLLESPTNPLLKIADLASITADVKEKAPDAIVVVDNTMMSPYLQRPLECGVDIVYDSATKYLSGHHDLMAGAIVCNRDDIAKQLAFTINAVGNALAPMDSFLLLRGIKTLAIRMDRQQATAIRVASYLHRLGFPTFYPGLSSHPGNDIHQRLANGPGAVLSFVTGDKEVSERIVGGTRLWGISVSFGAVNSLISMPCLMSHASIDPATRAARGLPEDLIRLCVGIEDATDLLDDLELALISAGAIVPRALPDNSIIYERPNQAGAITQAIDKLARPDISRRVAEHREWFVSAPGKVILFGEHAVVHGVTAIAAAVDLRCYALTTPRHDGKLSLHLPDIGNFSHTWDLDKDLPWDAVSPVPIGTHHPAILNARLVEAIKRILPSSASEDHPKPRAASIAFLYIYMSLMHGNEKPSFSFVARSTLPIGAGLGSSASYSTCVASTLLLLHQRFPIPPDPKPTSEPSGSDPGHIHLSHGGRRAIPKEAAAEINNWAFVAEKILHGNPSGIDNAVAVHGSALAYTREGFGRKAGMEEIHGFKSIRFLLVDTKVSRDTKSLVAGVGRKKEQEPEVVEPVLASIQAISDEARRALSDPEIPRDTLIKGLTALIKENHAHLVTLGVSHASLEAIRELTAASPYELPTKLTGAGGGGCAVTLIPDGFPESKLQDLIAELERNNFQPYLTTIGGSGVGVLWPREGEAIPTASSAPDGTQPSLRKMFEEVSKEQLAGWAASHGRWVFV